MIFHFASDRRADAVIATTTCTSKNGRNHFHPSRFCCRFSRGGASDPHLVVMTKSPAQNWSGKSRASASGEDRNVQTEEGRAGSAEKRSALCGPLRSSCPPYQGSTDPLCLCLSGWDWFDLTVVSLTDLLITCLFVCLVIVAQGNKWTFIRKSWNIDDGSRHRWLHFGDFPDTTGTFDLSKIKAKLSECFSSLSFFFKDTCILGIL